MDWPNLNAYFTSPSASIHIASIPDLRCHLSYKHLAESSKLPTTFGTLQGCGVVSSHWCGIVHSTHSNMAIIRMTIVRYYLLPQRFHLHHWPLWSSSGGQPRIHNLVCTNLCLCGSDCENDMDCNVENDTRDMKIYKNISWTMQS